MGDNEYGGEEPEHQEQHDQGEFDKEDAQHDNDAGVGEGEEDWGDDGGWGEDGPGFRGRGGWRGPRGRGMRGFGRGGFGRGFGRGFGPPGLGLETSEM